MFQSRSGDHIHGRGASTKINVLVACDKQLGFDLLLGINTIKELGSIVVGAAGSVEIDNGRVTMCTAMHLTSLLPSTI